MNKNHYNTEQICKYLLNRMTLEEETAFQNHIATCEVCAKRLNDLIALRGAFDEESDCDQNGKMPKTATPVHNVPNQELKGGPSFGKRRSGGVKLLIGIASIAAVVILSLILWPESKAGIQVEPGTLSPNFGDGAVFGADSTTLQRDSCKIKSKDTIDIHHTTDCKKKDEPH